MRIKALFGGLAAATLAAQPISAAAVSHVAPSTEGANSMGGESGTFVGIALFVAAVAAFYLVASNDDGDDDPVSA